MMTFKVGITRVFLVSLVVLSVTIFHGEVLEGKAYADEVWGSHAYCWGNETIFNLIWTTYGGSDWYPVTVMVGVDGRGVDNLQAVFANATSGGKKLYPILRLTSQGGANWSKIDPDDAAAMLNAVTPSGFPGPIYVAFGNETHMDNEWDGATDPSPEYGDFYRRFAAAMAGNNNYVVGHAAVNLSFPPGEEGEGWAPDEGPGDRAERFYSSVAGKGAGSFASSQVLFSNPYELGSVPFPDDPGIPGNAYRAGTILNISEHIDIDRHYNSQQGGSNSPNIWMEFGLHPGAPIPNRQAFLETAYASYPNGNYSGLDPKATTPMLMSSTEKYIVVYKDAGGIAYIKCTGSSCGDEICAGGSARNNPAAPPPVVVGPIPGGGATPTEPPCVPGQYKLTIKGTIKSSNVFLQSVDAVTGENSYKDVRSLAAGTTGDIPYVQNVPVNGAIVQLHDSQKLDQYGEHVNSPGMIDGMLKQPYKSVTTKPDGTFTIEAESHCGRGGNVYRSDWRGTGYEQYLSISCADKLKTEASARMIVKDVLGYVLDLTGTGSAIQVNLGDINVDCQAVPWKTYPNVSRPTGLISFAHRSKEVFLSCSGANRITRSGLEGYKYQPWDMDLIFKDSWDSGSVLGWLSNLMNQVGQLITGDGSCDGMGVGCWGEWLKNHVPFNGRTEVRTAPQTKLYSMEEHAILIDTLLGTRGGTLENGGAIALPKYYQNGAPSGADTYNNHEEKPVLVDCESFRRCSSTLGEEAFPLDNAQTCGGMWNNLAPPFGGVVRDANGNIDTHLSADLIRYQNLPKERKVCKGTGGTEVLVRNIMPLPGLCGDINRDGVVAGEAGGEMPCPQRFTCGDQDGNGVVSAVDGEVACTAVMMESATPGDYSVASAYRYDVRYFPYSMLYNADVYNQSEAQSETTRTDNDSFSSYCPRGYSDDGGYQATEGSGGSTKPSVRGCINGSSGALTFYSQTETKYPCTDWTCFKKNENLETTAMSSVNPIPATVMGTPQFINSTDSREVVQRSLEQMVQTVTVTERGHFFRLGIPDDLCTCSLVENGSNVSVPSLKNCVQTDANVLGGGIPATNDPGNIFTPVRDQIIGGSGGNDSHLPGDFPGVPFSDPTNPSRVAGGADWEGLQAGVVSPAVKTPNDARAKHYDQATQTPGSFLDTLAEAVSCAFNHSVYNIVTQEYEGGANCGRELRVVAKNVGLGRGTLPNLLKNGLVLLNSLDPPEVQMDQVLIRSAGPVDRTMTKPERQLDGNPYGFNSSSSNTTSQTTVPGSQGSSYIYDYGVGKKIQRDKFMNLVSSPIFTGQEVPTCRTVRGWEVMEFPNQGLFAVDCDDASGECVAGGATDNENWSSGPRLLLKSTNYGRSWTTETGFFGGSADDWLHGVAFTPQTGPRLAAGRHGLIYTQQVGFLWTAVQMTRTGFAAINALHPAYMGYLYDIAGGPGGYLATGGGHVFYSQNGLTGWTLVAEHDNYPGSVACEGPDYAGPANPTAPGYADRYNCSYPDLDPAVPMTCDNNYADNTLPNCCCDSNDGSSRTPDCPAGALHSTSPIACWTWGDSSIWGVDCNTAGDCFIAGQYTPKVWYAPSASLGNVAVWRASKIYLGPSCSGCSAMGVAFAGNDKAVIVEGKKGIDEVAGGCAYGSTSGSATILTNTRLGGSWGSWTTVAGISAINTDLRSVDCFDATNCAAVGTNGIILITKDGGSTWKEWGEVWPGDATIAEAKTQGVRFWDVAYKDADTIVAVGFKPSSPNACGVSGVIYTLGEREDCGGYTGPNCSMTSPACSASSSGTAFWSNSNSVHISGPDILAGGGAGINITGTIQIRDAFTYPGNPLNNTQSFVYNNCQGVPRRGCPHGPGLPVLPRLTLSSGGVSSVYELDVADIATKCPTLIGDIEMHLVVPTGYTYDINIDGLACYSASGVVGVANQDARYEGHVWQQAVGGGSLGLCGQRDVCDAITRKWCDDYDSDPWIDMACSRGCGGVCGNPGFGDDVWRGDSGNCYACGFGFPTGFRRL